VKAQAQIVDMLVGQVATRSEIETATGLSQKQITRAMKQLRELNLIEFRGFNPKAASTRGYAAARYGLHPRVKGAP